MRDVSRLVILNYLLDGAGDRYASIADHLSETGRVQAGGQEETGFGERDRQGHVFTMGAEGGRDKRGRRRAGCQGAPALSARSCWRTRDCSRPTTSTLGDFHGPVTR